MCYIITHPKEVSLGSPKRYHLLFYFCRNGAKSLSFLALQQLHQISPQDEQLRKSGSSLWLSVLPGSCSSDSAPQSSPGPAPQSSPGFVPQILLLSPPWVLILTPPQVLLPRSNSSILPRSNSSVLPRSCSFVLPRFSPS